MKSKAKTAKAKKRGSQNSSDSLERLVRRLIRKYANMRGGYHRKMNAARKRGDEMTEIVAGSLALAYTNAQVHLEEALEPSNGALSDKGAAPQ